MSIFYQTYGFYPFDVYPVSFAKMMVKTLIVVKTEIGSDGKTNEVIIDRVRYEALSPWLKGKWAKCFFTID